MFPFGEEPRLFSCPTLSALITWETIRDVSTEGSILNCQSSEEKEEKKREDFGTSQFEKREGIEKESKLCLNLFDVVFGQPI